MELTYVTIVVLALMIFVLSGMVGYLYWQQTRMLQHIQSLAMALATYSESQEVEAEPEAPGPPPVEAPESEDDRASVELPVETVQGPPDVDDLHEKTSAQLRQLLTEKGIPFGKRDSKNVLLELLKTTA